MPSHYIPTAMLIAELRAVKYDI